MLKLPGVDKIFNGWRADWNPFPLTHKKGNIRPKKEISDPKKDVSPKKIIESKNGKKNFFQGNYGWLTCQLKIITNIYMKVNVFLVP